MLLRRTLTGSSRRPTLSFRSASLFGTGGNQPLAVFQLRGVSGWARRSPRGRTEGVSLVRGEGESRARGREAAGDAAATTSPPRDLGDAAKYVRRAPRGRHQDSAESHTKEMRFHRHPRQQQVPARAPDDYNFYDNADMVADIVNVSSRPEGSAAVLHKIRNSDRRVHEEMLDRILSDGAVVSMARNRSASKVITSLLARANADQRAEVAQQLSGHLRDLWSSKTGSIFLRSSLEVLDRELSVKLLAELLRDRSEAAACAADAYGCFVIEHVIKFGGRKERSATADALRGSAVTLALGERGKYVVSTLLAELDGAERQGVVDELLEDGDVVVKCIHDEHASHVINQLLNDGSASERARVVQAFRGRMLNLVKGRRGGAVAAATLQTLGCELRRPLVDELLASSENMADCFADAGGCFVIWYLFHDGSGEERAKVARWVQGNVVDKLCKSANGALFLRRVMEEPSDGEERDAIISELLSYPSPVWMFEMAIDHAETYLWPHLLSNGTSEECNRLLGALSGRLAELAMHEKGFRLVRSALKVRDQSIHDAIVSELLASPPTVYELAKSTFGARTILELLSQPDAATALSFLTATKSRLMEISRSEFGSSLVSKALRDVDDSSRDDLILGELLAVPEDVATCAQHHGAAFLVQYFLTECSDAVRDRVCETLMGRWVEMAMHKTGSFVVKCALETADEPTRERIAIELLDSSDTVLRCALHPAANFVVRQLLETGTAAQRELAIDMLLLGDMCELSTDKAGKFVVFAALDNASATQRGALVGKLLASGEGVKALCMDRQGNVVIEHILAHGKNEEHEMVMKSLEGHVVELALDSIGHHALMFALEVALPEQRARLASEILDSPEHMTSCLSSQCGRLVVRLLEDLLAKER